MSSSRLAYLDGWRGLAIIGLLIGHFFPVPGINLGRVGVDLFFVLSGLLMGRLLFLDQVALPTFFKRRVSRILPATLVFVAVVCLAHWANGAPISWFELSTALLFVKNYWPESVTLPFGHIWSLSVEEHSYLFLAALAFVVRSRRWPALLLLGSAVIFSVGATFVLNATEPGRTAAYDWRLRTETAAYGILVSAWLQVWFAQRGGPPRLLAHAAPLALVVGVLLHWWAIPYAIGYIASVGFLALAVNLLGSDTPRFCRALSHPVLCAAGVWSFSVYLWQQPLYQMVHHKRIDVWTGVLLALACGLLSFYLVEQPMRRFLNRGSRIQAPAPAVVGASTSPQ